MLCQVCAQKISRDEIHKRYPKGTREGDPLLYDIVMASEYKLRDKMYSDLTKLNLVPALMVKEEVAAEHLWPIAIKALGNYIELEK